MNFYGFRKLRLVLVVLGATAVCGLPAVQAQVDGKTMKRNPSRRGSVTQIGKRIPGFTKADLENDQRSLSDYAGKILVLEWTNHNCPFAQRHAKAGTIARLQEKYKNDPVEFLAIDSGEQSQQQSIAIRKWRKGNGLNYPIVLDPKGRIGRAFGARTTPHIFIADRQHYLAYEGAIDDDPDGKKATKRNYVEEAIDALLAQRPLKVVSTKPYGCSVKYGPE